MLKNLIKCSFYLLKLEGKSPLKPLYLDEWNVRRSERIFLSDPSPQTSPNTVSPGAAGGKIPSPGSGKPRPPNSPTAKQRPDTVKTDDAKQRLDRKKSQSLNMSMKVKKKYSSGMLQQNKARERTTELLQVRYFEFVTADNKN